MKNSIRMALTGFALLWTLLLCPGAQADTLLLPSGVTAVEEEAFCGDTGLDHVALPEGLQRIGARAFAGSSIRSIDLPASLEYIAEDAFEDTSIRSATARPGTYAYTWACVHGIMDPGEDYGDWDPSIEEPAEDTPDMFDHEIGGDGAYITAYRGNSSCIVIPAEIGDKKVVSVRLNPSLQNNYMVTKIVLPAQPIALADKAFSHFPNLTEIEGLEHVSSVGAMAFSDTAIRKLAFSDDLHRMGESALIGSIVQELVIPDDVEYDPLAFTGYYLRSISLLDGAGTASVMLRDGVLFSADGKTLLCCPAWRQAASYTVPDGTEHIADGAFITGDPLAEIIFPDSVTSFDHYACYQAVEPTDLVVNEGSAAHAYASELARRDFRFRCVLSGSQSETLQRFISGIVEENAASGSDYEKALALHDWLIDYAEYDHRESGIAYNCGADMLRYGKGVCAAYAEAYQMLLTEAGIRCRTVGNSTHEFDAVRIGDDWFYVDCTWDDNGADAQATHTYFGFEDTIRYAVYGAANPASLDGIIIDPTIVKTRQYKYHYWYKQGYCSTMIEEALAAVETKLRSGNSSFSIRLSENEKITGLLTAAFITDHVFTFDGIEAGVDCSWSDGQLYCTLSNDQISASVDDYVFDIKNNQIRILQYTGEEKIVIVPARINGIEVGCIGPAFYGNLSVANVLLPNTVVEIEGNAFRGAASLQKINFPSRLKKIGANAFRSCVSLSSDVVLPSGFTTLGFGAFESCYSIHNVVLPSTVSVDDLAFSDCIGLDSVTLAEGITVIPSSIFSGCKMLSSVTLPESVERIEGNAFYGTALSELVIPARVSYMGCSPIQECRSLVSLTVAAGNRYYKAEDNIVFTADGSRICFSAPSAGAENYTIPSGVTSLEERAFCGNRTIRHLIVPGSVEEIGSEAFAGSFSEGGTPLESVIIRDGCKTIGMSCFAGCKNLTTLELPDSVTSLGEWAFHGAPLEELHIPAGVTYIPTGLFSEGIKRLYIHENVTGSDVVFYNEHTTTVYGKAGTFAEAYAEENGLVFIAIE